MPARKDPIKAELQMAVAVTQPGYDDLLRKDPAAGWAESDLRAIVEHNRRQRALWRYQMAQKEARAAQAAGADTDNDPEGESDD